MATFPFPDPRRRRSLLEQLMPQVNPALLEGYSGPQGLMDPTPPATTGTTPLQAAPRGGFRGALDSLTSGQDDPRLSPEQNAIARKQATIQAGLAMMAAAGQPGATAGSSIAQGLMQGQGVGGDARAQAYGMTQQERLTQALQDPTITSKLSPQQLAMIRMMPPEQAAKVLSELAFATPQESKVLGPNAVLVGPNGEQIASNLQEPEPDPLPPDLRALLWSRGVDPDKIPVTDRAGLMEQYGELKRAGGTSVTLNTGAQMQRGLTEQALGAYNQISDDAITAERRMDTLQLMDSLLAGGMPTGGLEEMTAPLRNLAASMGMADADKLGRQQLFSGIANGLALEMKEGMTGPMSDRDIKFLQKQVPALGNTVEGNRLLVEVMRRFARRKIEIANLADQYMEDNGSLSGWNGFRRKWVVANPLTFSDLAVVGTVEGITGR